MNTLHRTLVGVFLAGVVIASLVVGILAPLPSTRVQYVAAQRTCFPLQDWSTGTVPARMRPCAEVQRVYEDGSVVVRVTDADGTVRWSDGIGAEDR